jgi:hypothetical protein
MSITGKTFTNSPKSAMKKSFGGTFSFSKCQIIGFDTGSLVLIVFVQYIAYKCCTLNAVHSTYMGCTIFAANPKRDTKSGSTKFHNNRVTIIRGGAGGLLTVNSYFD